MNKLRHILILCWIGLSFTTISCFAEMYKWVDQNGVKHFSDNPSNTPISSQPTSTPSQAINSGKPAYGQQIKKTFPVISIREMLSNRDFKKLNVTLSDFQKAYEKDVRNEDNLLDAYLAFSVNDVVYEALLNEWVKNHPSVYQPYIARASYYYHLGWESRGGKWTNDTTDKQIEGMRNYFSKAKQDVEQALKLKPDHIVPYYLLINIYKATGNDGEKKKMVKKALEECPNSFRVRSSFLLSIAPRWGGTYEEMDQFATESLKYVSKNSRIKTLKGYVFYDAGSIQRSSKNYGVALEFLNKALAFGDLALFYEERANIYDHLERYDEALKDINTAIEISPQNPNSYSKRARIFGVKKMMREALKDIEIADQLKPNDEFITKQKKWIVDTFVYSGFSQQKTKNLSGAIADYDSAIQANPKDAYSYYRRARAFIDNKDQASAFNDLKKAIELDPNDFDFYLLMDWILAQKSDWDGITNYWGKYIVLNPNNDRAYLERGGAYFRKGDHASAVADAKRAADLGNAEGKKMYDRYKGQAKK